MGKLISSDITVDDTVIMEAKFTDPESNDAAIDPDTVKLVITEPDNTKLTKTKANGDLTNPSVGTYQFRHKATQAGVIRWKYTGEITSPSKSASDIGKVYVDD